MVLTIKIVDGYEIELIIGIRTAIVIEIDIVMVIVTKMKLS